MDPGFTKVKRLFFRDLTPYIFSSKRWFFQKYFFDIIYLLYHNLLTKSFIIIPYVAHNEWRTFTYLEHFVGIMAPSTWSLMATPLAIQAPMPMTVSSTFSSVGSILHGTGTCKPCAWFWKPQAGPEEKRRGWDGYRLVLDFDSPPKKKNTCGTKRVEGFQKMILAKIYHTLSQSLRGNIPTRLAT